MWGLIFLNRKVGGGTIFTMKTKICPECGVNRPITDYHSKGWEGNYQKRERLCRFCGCAHARKKHLGTLSPERQERLKRLRDIRAGILTERLCARCQNPSEGNDRPYCRECRCRLAKEHYWNSLSEEQKASFKPRGPVLSPGVRAAREKERKKRLNDLRTEFSKTLKVGKSCQDCGGIFHFTAMEFDHLDPRTKVAGVSQLPPGDAKLKEVAKCDLVCANCHRVRTARRRQGLPAVLPEPEYFI